MKKKKKDPTTIGLPSSQPEGQGTGYEKGPSVDSARKKTKR
ncbi:YuzL family protein [Pseudalkalibacillus salsuginis]|nr:YuzL family protein [Pseudalkalibacillus salsuginis]MCF6410820.1 YuzL family protein [Pseudalkalibacillus salsuginis]